MTSNMRPEPVAEQVSCSICLQEVPLSAASSFEAEDYIVHFCGIECYSTWKNQGGGVEPEAVVDG